MYLFQIEWQLPDLTGYQQDTILRACLYNLKVIDHYHLFPRVGRTDITYVSLEKDLTLVKLPVEMKIVFLKKIKEPVKSFRVVGNMKDKKHLIKLEEYPPVEDFRKLTKYQLKDSPFKSLWVNQHDTYKPQRLTLDIRKFYNIISCEKDMIVLEVLPTVSLKEVLSYLKINKWSVLV